MSSGKKMNNIFHCVIIHNYYRFILCFWKQMNFREFYFHASKSFILLLKNVAEKNLKEKKCLLYERNNFSASDFSFDRFACLLDLEVL